MKPLLSVVVPVHNVEDYLEECLGSLAGQSLKDIEVVLVDDGSTDGSRRIAEDFAARDTRFRCVHQPNAGLSAARNAGVARTTAGVPYLAFADSDDVLVPDAYERMLASLESTGSDLVTGNVWRLTGQGRQQAWQYRWLTADHPRTHITRDARLLADRVAWNKVFRRSFWDRHGFSFPEGKLYEDTPVMIPAHHLAGSVDVLREHVYHWRVREGSITRRRTDVRGVRDRIAACEQVSAFLGGLDPAQRLRYDASCLRDDFVYFLEGLPMGGPAYRSAFMRDAGAFLDRAGEAAMDGLPADARIRWQLVRERRTEELLAVLEFERANGTGTFTVTGLPGRRRAAHPGITGGTGVSARLGKGDLPAVARLVEASWGEDGRLRLRGYAYIRNLPARAARQSLKAGLVRETAGGRMRAVPVRTVRTDRATADSGQELHCYNHAGFEMVLDPGKLRPGSWQVGVVVAGHGVVRRAALRAVEAAAAQPLVHDLGGGRRAVLGYRDGRLELTVARLPAVATGHHYGAGALELTGRLYGGTRPTALVLTRDGAAEHVCPVRCEDGDGDMSGDEGMSGGAGGSMSGGAGGFSARIPLAALTAGPAPALRAPHEAAGEPEGLWRAALVTGGVRVPLAAAPDLPPPALADAAGDLVVDVTGAPRVDHVGPAPDGGLRVHGTGTGALVLRHRTLGETVTVPVAPQEPEGQQETEGRGAARFAAVLAPPPREGDWEVLLDGRPVRVGAALAALLPVDAADGRFRLDRRHGDRLTAHCAPALGDAGRSAYRQGRLRTAHYPAQRRLPLRETVLYTGEGSPRAVHAELVRRSTDAEHLWVTDGSAGAAARVPSTAVPVVAHSTAWYEALARARRIVAAGQLPAWFERRPEQTVVQTWHGPPLGRFGLDLTGSLYADHQYLATLEHRSAQWSVLVSPSAFATPHLCRALAYRGEVLEAGSPADDLLSAPGRDRTAARVRRELGVPDGHRVVLYAPTYRDHLAHAPADVPLGAPPLHRWDPALDLSALARSLDGRTTVLVRRHPRVTGSVPAHPALLDVSAHPDATELLLIADVLVTDYSGLVFGFAHTGRPVLFHTYDLEHYRDTVRGFCLDFEARAPGPLLLTTQEVAQALRDIPASADLHAEAYESFRRDHCGPADGGAARRVADRLLDEDAGSPRPVRP
ncbi:MAG TPA: CDP-glycerol glycerophosphotransferase family protein [Streptomyces sp.]|uniref:bifunctional glycosyltransferase/CDP-glycerol:glycerophosphate glycerophosphotransferase n=1 Tax=Streptomyces sp. TaxID=1931 RepID=UPI002C69B730|nr:CDP-glycerol glycerophosphotransferase family protein [Streptomyces sp.]HWU09044.1 CDP-glycerol glycerophosphotransferase family protein [Streptomyces sp.]